MESLLQKNKITPSQELLMAVHYMPCVDFYAVAIKHHKITFEVMETFPKQTYRNRCHIYSANGSLTLSIPLNKKNNTITKDVKIDHSENWRMKHWRAIQSAYSNTAFFLYFQDYFEEVFLKKNDFLLDWNITLFEMINNLLKQSLPYNLTTDFIRESSETTDYREKIHPKQKPLLSIYPEYFQPFAQKHGFIHNLSIIDALFNLGIEETKKYLKKTSLQI